MFIMLTLYYFCLFVFLRALYVPMKYQDNISKVLRFKCSLQYSNDQFLLQSIHTNEKFWIMLVFQISIISIKSQTKQYIKPEYNDL